METRGNTITIEVTHLVAGWNNKRYNLHTHSIEMTIMENILLSPFVIRLEIYNRLNTLSLTLTSAAKSSSVNPSFLYKAWAVSTSMNRWLTMFIFVRIVYSADAFSGSEQHMNTPPPTLSFRILARSIRSSGHNPIRRLLSNPIASCFLLSRRGISPELRKICPATSPASGKFRCIFSISSFIPKEENAWNPEWGFNALNPVTTISWSRKCPKGDLGSVFLFTLLLSRYLLASLVVGNKGFSP